MNTHDSNHRWRKKMVSVWLLAGLMACAQAGASDGQDAFFADEDCHALLADAQVRHALHLVKAQLQAQGMRLHTNGCPYVRTAPGQMQQVLDVAVRVVDSYAAAAVVRGPLADGEDVDMGDTRLQAQAQGLGMQTSHAEEEAPPDVLFNRAWLARVMQARGFDPLPAAWWGFVPRAQGL